MAFNLHHNIPEVVSTSSVAEQPSAYGQGSGISSPPSSLSSEVVGESSTASFEKSYKHARRRFLNAWTLVAVVLLAAVVIYLLKLLNIAVGIVLWTCVLVFCMHEPVEKLQQKGLPRVAGAAIVFLGFFAAIALVIVLLFLPAFGVGGQFNDLIQHIPVYIDNITAWGNSIYEQYAGFFSDSTVQKYINEFLNSIGNWATSFAGEGATKLIGATAELGNILVIFFLALVVTFWILLDLPNLGKEVMRLAGPKHQDDMKMWHITVTHVMAGYIKGTLLQCTLIGVGCGILFLVAGVPNSAALGVITGILNVLPIVGPWLGSALAAIVGVFVSPAAAMISLVGSIIIQHAIYNLVTPKIMANSVDVHPALTITALMAGSAIGEAMGGLPGALVGMLASIPAVAVAKALFVYYFEKNTGRHLVSEEGVFFKGTRASADHVDPIADATSPHPGATGSLPRLELVKREHKRSAATKQNESGNNSNDADRI